MTLVVPSVGGTERPLPGPGLDVPIDVDGDGVSTFGDRYAFNYWLELGGSLEKAFSTVVLTNRTLDVSEFFRSRDAEIKLPALVVENAAEEGAEAGGGAGQPGDPPTSATILPPFADPNDPIPPSLGVHVDFEYPTGFDMDRL